MSQSYDHSKPFRFVFTGKQEVHIENFEVPAPAKGQVLTRTLLTQMSTGTENIVFNRAFDPGTHFDKWVQYPFYPGYIHIGVIEAVGEGVEKFKVGEVVAARNKHATHCLEDESKFYKIPQGLPLEQAIWFALAKICWHGAHVADYKLGDSVLVIGAGPIGQMSIRWARATGVASITVVDSMASRLEIATKGGATAVISSSIEQSRDQVLAANGGNLPRVVIDTTGNATVFASALTLARNFGKVVILGDTGRPAQQTLTSDVITRGLTIVGTHDCHVTEEWNNATIAQLFFTLAVTGRFPLEGMTTHTFKPEQCVEAYTVANRDRAKTMGILFDWSK